MKLKIILLILLIVFIAGCSFSNLTISETVPCKNCSDKLLSIQSLKECSLICKEKFETSKGSRMLGKEITQLTGYKKTIQWENGEKKVSCVCSYK